MRIAIGGISHESNTFNPLYTDIESFKVVEGKDLLRDEVAEFLLERSVDVVPTLYARALPSGVVSREAYLKLKNSLLARLEAAGDIDGICLLLHGALEVEGIGDGESDLVKSIREVVGEDVLISASLDLHGNIDPEFVKSVNILTAYRTAPHTDVVETKLRAARTLLKSLRKGFHPVSVIVKPPVLLPGELVVTEVYPASFLYSSLRKIESLPGILDASLFVGMAWADTPNSCASAVVVAEEDYVDEAYEQACKLGEAYWNLREEFHYEVKAGSIRETIEFAEKSPEGPVFISDSGDNVTAGATGDVPLFVEQLLAMNVADAVVGGILDPEAVKLCREIGVGNRLKVEIGGKIDRVNGYPVEVNGEVLNLTETGVVLRTNGIDVILTSQREAWTSLESFRKYGVEPLARKIVVVKLGYLTPEFREIAKKAFMALSPGCTNQMIEQLNYKNVRRPLFPLDKNFTWKPPAESEPALK